MATPPQQPSRIAFGPFDYDGTSGELRKQGTRLRLAGQPLRILEVMLDRPGEVVSREEIQKQLWNGTTFVDFEHGLNAAINKLRQTLGDSADRPRYIETLPGRGYRFIAALEKGSTRQAPPAAIPESPQLESGTSDRAEQEHSTLLHGLFNSPGMLVVLTVAFVIFAAATIVLLRVRRPPSSAPAAEQTVRFRLAIPGNLHLSSSETFSLSPDGKTLVYHASGSDGVQRLWAQRMDSLEPRALTGTESGDDPPAFWSPDSKQVAFYSNGELRKTDLTGGVPQTLCRVPGIVSGGSWNREGVIIFGPVTGGLMKVSANGGTAVPITELDTSRKERNHLFPVFLRDGRHFIYSRLSSVNENSGIYLGSLDATPIAPEGKRLVGSMFGAALASSPDGREKLLYQQEGVLWARDIDTSDLELTGDPIQISEHVGSHRGFGYFSTSKNGTLVHRSGVGEHVQLAWFDRHGKQLTPVGEPIDVDSAPVLSPDATRIAVARFESGVDIWVYDLARVVKQRVTSNPALEVGPVWSADGKRIAFSSSRHGHYDLYQTPAGGESTEELLYSSGENKYFTSWSTDGRFLLYEAQAGDSGWNIWMLPMEGMGARTPMPLLNGRANERSGAFSPDGHWIAYVSDESGIAEVYVQPFPPLSSGVATGRGQLVSRDGGTRPAWRADGQELFYRTPDGALMSVGVKEGAGFSSKAPKSLFRTPLTGFSRADASADGSRFLLATPVEQATPQTFTVVLNWQAELKK